jgi:hypothetical protein
MRVVVKTGDSGVDARMVRGARMSRLSVRLSALIEALAHDIVEAVRHAPISELAKMARDRSVSTKPRRRVRTEAASAPGHATEPAEIAAPIIEPEFDERAFVTDPEQLLAGVVVNELSSEENEQPRAAPATPSSCSPLYVLRRRRSEEDGTIHEERVLLPERPSAVNA